MPSEVNWTPGCEIPTPCRSRSQPEARQGAMAHVRKITTAAGTVSWQATVRTLSGKRKSKNHPTKKAADAWAREHDGAGAGGSASMTVLELAKSHNRWFEGIVKAGE